MTHTHTDTHGFRDQNNHTSAYICVCVCVSACYLAEGRLTAAYEPVLEHQVLVVKLRLHRQPQARL